MNRIYKVIWSNVRKCYVVVAEIAKNHGKNNIRSIVERLAAHLLLPAKAQWAIPAVTAGLLLLPVSGWTTEITNVNGIVEQNGNVYNVYTQKVVSQTLGINEFNKFDLDSGHIANMHFNQKDKTVYVNDLVNLVKERINVNGTLNAIKDGKIDGNLYFLSPNGMVVGSTGVINAGKFVALAPDSSYFNNLWNNEEEVSAALKGDFKDFGARHKQADKDKGIKEGDYKSTNLEFNTDKASEKGIVISGQINTRSGIVLGAGHIAIENGAVLKNQKDLDFANLVNTQNAAGANFSNIGMTATSEGGDIILRAETSHKFENSPILLDSILENGGSNASEFIDSLTNINSGASVTVNGTIINGKEVNGKLKDGGNVDISAASKTTFSNKEWPGISGLSDLGKETLSDLGINVAADFAIKHNTASVTLGETGVVKAAENVNLRADATVSIIMLAKTVSTKDSGTPNNPAAGGQGGDNPNPGGEGGDNQNAGEEGGANPGDGNQDDANQNAGNQGQAGTSSAIPVTAVAVAHVENKALVDVKGELVSGGDMELTAATNTKADIAAKATTKKKEGDTGNAIYLGVSLLFGDSVAEVNVDAQSGEGKQLSAGGAFAATATANSDVAVEAVSAGTNDTFASTSVAVLDYDSAANVNLKRNVEAESINVKGVNQVDSLGIKSDNSNGEGTDPMVKFEVTGDTNVGALTKIITNKLGATGFRQGGKLQGLENTFQNVLSYVTAGAAVGVVDNTNTANVTVAPSVELKATGPAVKKGAGGKDIIINGIAIPGGDVSIEAGTNMKSLSHEITGQLNKQTENNAQDNDNAQDNAQNSKVNVAAAFLYSNIDNDATVELQSGNSKGVKLTSENGSVNLKSDVHSDDENTMSMLRKEGLKEHWDQLIAHFKKIGKDTSKLTEWQKDTVNVEKQLEDGTISTAEAATNKINALAGFGSFLASEVKNGLNVTNDLKKIIQDLTDYLNPASYTNYYVRSYALNGNEAGDTATIAASVNIADLENKGIIAIGEKSVLKAGKDINIHSEAKTEVISGTGNGGEWLAYSETNGTGIGASVAWQDISADGMVLVGKNVEMQAGPANGAGDGSIYIDTDVETEDYSIIISGGKADRSGLSGSLNVQDGGSNSLVLVDDEATLTAADKVSLLANNKLTAFNLVGGLALGSAKSTATAGAGIGINRLDATTVAEVGDNGQGASVTVADTEDSDNKDKSVEEKNRIKTENTLASARKVAAERGKIRSMDREFVDSKTDATARLGAKTAVGAAKGSITAKDVAVKAASEGTVNAVAVEGVSNSENHKGLDTINKWNKTGNKAKSNISDSLQNLVGWPAEKANKAFGNSETKKNWNFRGYEPIPQNNDAADNSYNIAAAGSVSVNWNNSETAAVIDNTNVVLNKKSDGKGGTLVNEATDDVFTGAWSGAAALNWFTGGEGTAANNNAHKVSVGAAVALNKLTKDVKAQIRNTGISNAGLIENTVIRKGTEAAAALGLAVTNDSQGQGTNVGATFGLAMNKVDSNLHALMIDDESVNTNSTGTDISNRAYDGDIQVAGGVDISFANSSDQGRAIAAGITAAVSEINNDMQSGILGGRYTGVKDLKVAGEEALTQVNAAVALGIANSNSGFAGAASLAYAELENTNHGFITGTDEIKATGEVSVTNRDISGSKDNNPYVSYLKDRKVDATGEGYLSDDTKTNLGKEAGSTIVNVAVEGSGSKSATAGAALAIGNITNKFSADITDNKKLEADAVKAAADVHTNIVSVSAGISVSTKSWGGVGSLSFIDLDQDNIVSVTGNRNGDTDGITANTVSGSAKNTSHIVNVTGDFAGGKNAVGLGIAYNYMADTTGIYVADNRIQAKDVTNGVNVSLDADNNAYALALSVGAAATYSNGGAEVDPGNNAAAGQGEGDAGGQGEGDAGGQGGGNAGGQGNGIIAAHGNFGINRGHNDTIAVIGENKDGSEKKEKIINASSVTVKTTDNTSKTTIAGSGTLALNSPTVALGVGVALTESEKGTAGGDGRESVRVEINNADITTVKAGDKAPVISATSTDTSKATTVSVGIGLAKSAKFAVQGVGADANIYKNNTAGMKDTTIDANGGSKAALVNVQASTASTLKTGAAAVQLSGSGSFLAGVVAVGTNRIKGNTTAAVTYTNKQTSVAQNVGNLDISATGKGDILSVAMGVSGVAKGIAAVGGSGSYNYIEDNATAKIEKANINSTGNIGVVAQSDEAVSNYAGVLDVAIAGNGLSAAIGVTGSNNKLSGKTEALIADSTVVAAGSGNNKIKTKSKLKANTDSEKYLIDSAVSRNTWSSGSFTEGEGETTQYGVSRLQKGREQEEKTGVVVDASATHSIASVMANGGVAVGSAAGVSVAGVVNLNYVTGETTAKVLDSNVNNANSRSDVTVHAADFTNVAEFSGAASVGVGSSAGIAAGFTGTTNEIDRVTAAGVSTRDATWDDTNKRYTVKDTSKTKNTVYANNFAVTADAKQAMSAFNVTGAVAGSTMFAFETGDNVNTNKLQSSTIATVTNTTADYTKDAVVNATHEDAIYNLNVEAGISVVPDPVSVAGSLNIGVGVVNEDSSVTANVENSEIRAHAKAEGDTAKSGLSVGAANSSKLEATLVSVGIAAGVFSAGVASSIAVNNIDSKVTSRIVGSVLTADTVTVDTANSLKIKDATGTGAGALLAGIGVGVDVNTLNDTVSTIVDGSTLKAKDTLSVTTKTQREIDSTVAGAGVGTGAGIAVNVLSVSVNDGINKLEDNQDEDAGSSFSHKDTINEILDIVNDNTKRDLSEHFHGMTDDQKQEMKEKVKTSAKSGDSISGTGVHTYLQNNSELEATDGALTVSNTELNGAELNGGGGSLGVGSVNVSDVVYHLNELNDIAVKDSKVKGGSVSMTARQGNVKDGKEVTNDEEAIHARTVQVAAGLAGIGVGYVGITTKGNTGISAGNSTVSATAGDLTLKSADGAKSKTEMTGISAALVSVPISVAHNTNQANNFVTVEGGSKLSATTDAMQEVTDNDGNKTTQKAPAYINLETKRTGRVASETFGVGALGLVVAVNVAKARDESTSNVTVAGSSNEFIADAVRMDAVNAPVVKAEAGGVAGSLIGVSVMHSNATAKSQANVTVEDRNKFLSDAVLARAVVGEEGKDMTHAETHGTNVAVGVAVNPNKAKAITETTAKVDMGNVSYKTEKPEKTKNEQGEEKEITVSGSYTDLALITQNNASRKAILGNTTIGLVSSIGTGDARTEGNDYSIVAAKGGADSAAAKLRNLKLAASGSNTAKGFADGDSGGVTAFGASATITMKTKTTNAASLSGAWDVAGNANIGAVHTVTSKGSSKTGAGGVLSVTWANSDNDVEMDTTTTIAEGAQLNAGQSYVLAGNNIVTGAYDGEHWNNHMNVGGVIQVSPDVKSSQVVNSKANVLVGKNARVTTQKGQVYDADSNADITNKVEGKSGGLAENMYVYSDSYITSTNKVTVNQDAKLEQAGEYENGSDITLSSSDKIKMDVAAETYIGGLEGMTTAAVDNKVTRNNSVEVNGSLHSTHDINLYAGVNPDGTDAMLDVTGLAGAHNNTLLSFKTTPELKLDVKNDRQVKVGTTGSAVSVRNINLTAKNGAESLKKDVVKVVNLFAKKDESTKTVTTASGDTDWKEDNVSYVDVEGLLKTGIQNNVKIDITGALIPKARNAVGQEFTPEPADAAVKTYNGAEVYVNGIKIEPGTETESNIIRPEDVRTGEMDYAAQLGTQLAALEKLIRDYSTDGARDDKQMAAYLGYIQQRQRILEEMEKRHLFRDEKIPVYRKDYKGDLILDSNGKPVPARDANNNIIYEKDSGGNDKITRVFATKGFTISYVEIPEITVSGGNIVVQSDNLYGNGSLAANGSPRIEINNLSNAYLKLNDMMVGELGGDIRFRGESISAGDVGKARIRELNKDANKKVNLSLYSDAASGVESAITVINDNSSIGNYLLVNGDGRELGYTAIPDVAIIGDIQNSNGLVRIENKQGNITIGSGDGTKEADVNGRTVQLIATQGSISQDYIDGIVNIGGRPEDINIWNLMLPSVRLTQGFLSRTSDDTMTLKDFSTPERSKDSAGRIAGDSVYLAAADINVNGLIQSGYGKYEVSIDADALSEDKIQAMQNNGSEVTFQGRTMYKLNDGNKAVYDPEIGAYKYLIQAYYDPETKGLVVEDIDTKGGKVYLTGRISSTGNGRILAVDGGAEIAITNNTKATLSTGKILNNDIEGNISITDLAKKTWTEYSRTGTKSMSISAYEKYLGLSDAYKADFAKLNDRQKVSYLNLTDAQRAMFANPELTDAQRAGILGNPTEAQISEAKIETAAAIGHNQGAAPSGSYSVQNDLRYNWTEGEDYTEMKYYRVETSTLFWGALEIGTGTSELAMYERAITSTPRTATSEAIGTGAFVGALDARYGMNDVEFGAIFENKVTNNSRTVTGSGTESGHWYLFWSDPTYWVTWTTKTGSSRSYTYTLKANKPVGVGFIGQKDGSISVANTNTVAGNVNLNGNILNNTKDAVLSIQSAGGAVIQKNGTSLTTGHADLRAKNNIENIHITSLGEQVAVARDNSLTYTANDAVKLSAVSDNAGSIDVSVAGGTVNGQLLPGNVVITRMASTGQRNTTEKPGDVSLKAEGNITQFRSLGQQFTITGAKQYEGENAVQDYLAADATYQALPEEDKPAYAARIQQDYNRFTELKQKFTKTGNAAGVYATAAEYLENNTVYKLLLGMNADHAARIRDEYANKSGNSSLENKFAGYSSAEEYLAQDKDYQNRLYYIASYRLKTEDEFAQFTTEPLTVRGKSVSLTSENGGIGTYKVENGTRLPDQALLIDSSAEAYGLGEDTASLNAQARKDIYLEERDGDMRVGSIISREGDVRLEADGRIIDALPQENNANKVDENDLIHHWIDAGLIAGTPEYEGAYIKGLKQDAANFETRVKEQYDLLDSGDANDQIRQMFTKADGTRYESAQAYLDALLADESEIGNFYKNTVKAYSNPEFAWTKEQLLYAVRNAIVNKETGVNAESQSKKANVQGRNVTLLASGIGVNTNQTTEIKVSELGGGSEESLAKMKQLANADAADVTMKDAQGNILRYVTERDDNNRLVYKWKAYDADHPETEVTTSDYVIDKFVIGNLSPLGVYATGQLDILASEDNAFVAGRSAGNADTNKQTGFAPINLGVLYSFGENDVRLYTQEGVYNALPGEGVNIHAKDFIVYGGAKDIGKEEKPLTVGLSGDLLEAYADGNVYIKNALADDKLRLGSVYAGDTVSLDSAAGFAMTKNTDYTLAYLNAGSLLELNSSETAGRIGSAADPIRILNSAGTPDHFAGESADDGTVINLNGFDGYVKGVNGLQGTDTTMRLGEVDMGGNFTASSESYLETGVKLTAESVEPVGNGKVEARGDVNLEALSGISIGENGNDIVRAGKNVNIHAVAGTIKVEGDIEAETGDVIVNNKMTNGQGDITVHGKVKADNNVIIKNQSNVYLSGVVEAGNNIEISNNSGFIEMDEDVIAGNDIVAKSKIGDIGLFGNINAGNDVIAETGGDGFLWFNLNLSDENYSVHAVRNVNLTTENSYLVVTGKLTTDMGDVIATTKHGGIQFSGDVNSGHNITASVTEGTDKSKLPYIMYSGTVIAANDITATTNHGDIYYNKSVQAGRAVEAVAGNGEIVVGESILAEQGDVSLTTNDGNITVGSDVTGKGNVTLRTYNSGNISITGNVTGEQDVNAATYNGDITFAGDVKAADTVTADVTGTGNIRYAGKVEAGKDVTGAANRGNVLYDGDVTSKSADVMATVNNGSIDYSGDVKAGGNTIGTVNRSGDINYTGTVRAGGEVQAFTANGQIRYGGNVEAGDKAAADVGAGRIWYGGNVRAGSDVTATLDSGIILYDGSVHAGGNIEATVTGEGSITYIKPVKAGRNVVADVNIGDILYNGDVMAGRSVISRTGSGSIAYMGKVTAGKDLPEQIRNGYGKIAYFDRFGLIGYNNSFAAMPVRNAAPNEIEINKGQQ